MKRETWKKIVPCSLAIIIICSQLCFQLFNISVYATGTNANPVALTDPDQLGDWLSYNGLIFGNITAYQADSEGPLAVGGDVRLGLSGGYDVGGAYSAVYSDWTQLGEYKNEGNYYPSLLLGGENIQLGANPNVPGSSHFNIYGGPIVMSQALLNKHNSMANHLNAWGYNGDGWMTADQSTLDNWFAQQYKTAKSASQQYLNANEVTVTLEELSNGYDNPNNSYLAAGAEKYVNQTLKYNGEVDNQILVVTVRTDSSVHFQDNNWATRAYLPISAEWAQNYELVIFNFPDAVDVQMSSDPQKVVNGLGGNKTSPDGHTTNAQSAERHAICENVVYNFPNATTITSNGVYLMGSLLAPDASFTASGGSINGQLVCTDFETSNSMELHALKLTRRAKEVVEDENEPETGSIRITKYLYYQTPTAHLLSDASFILMQKDGGSELYYDGNGNFIAGQNQAAVYSTTTNEPVTISGVPLGSYVLREIRAPDGYVLNTTDGSNTYTYYEYTVTIDTAGQIIEIARYNEPLIMDIHFMKTNASDGSALAGAKFTLVREADDLAGEISFSGEQGYVTSGADGRFSFSGLMAGTYCLTEIDPPDGFTYTNSGELRFQIYLDGSNTLQILDIDGDPLTMSERQPLEIQNTPGIPNNKVDIFKYDSETDGSVETPYAGLKNAKFDLYRETENSWELVTENDATDSEDKQSIDIVTSDTGRYQITHLAYGRYRMVETAAPEGYQLANNERDETALEVFPDGFTCEFEITADSDTTIPVYIANDRIKLYSFAFIKVDAQDNDTPLEGAEFVLLSCGHTHHADCGGLDDADDCSHIHSELSTKDADCCWQLTDSQSFTAASSPDGSVVFENLPSGEYQLVETKAPAGYKKPTGQWFISIDAEAQEVIEISARGSNSPPAFQYQTGGNGQTQYFLPNYKTTNLPILGGYGTIWFVAVGVALNAGAIAFLVSVLKKKKARK